MEFQYANNKMVNRLAFVGNLPSDPPATAEEMKQLCSQVGEVVLFTIVFDRETGKPKGYGFCEYREPKLVDAAVDLLHGFEHRGSNLFVSRANQAKQAQHKEEHANNTKRNNNKKKKKTSHASSKRKSVDEIVSVVSSFSTSEKREILSQMKLLIEQNEKGAKEILLENPQLAQALLFIQMEFNMIKVNDIHGLLGDENAMDQDGDDNKNEPKESSNTQSNKDVNAVNTEEEEEDPDTKMIEEVKDEALSTKVKSLSNQQASVLGRVMKMSAEEIAKLPPHVQKQVRAVQAQLAKDKPVIN
eukprot:239699_1